MKRCGYLFSLGVAAALVAGCASSDLDRALSRYTGIIQRLNNEFETSLASYTKRLKILDSKLSGLMYDEQGLLAEDHKKSLNDADNYLSGAYLKGCLIFRRRMLAASSALQAEAITALADGTEAHEVDDISRLAIREGRKAVLCIEIEEKNLDEIIREVEEISYIKGRKKKI